MFFSDARILSYSLIEDLSAIEKTLLWCPCSPFPLPATEFLVLWLNWNYIFGDSW